MGRRRVDGWLRGVGAESAVWPVARSGCVAESGRDDLRWQRGALSARTRILLALAAALATLILPAGAAHAANPAVSNQLIVGFKSGVSSSDQKSLLSSAG